jgi:hypothetical protein
MDGYDTPPSPDPYGHLYSHGSPGTGSPGTGSPQLEVIGTPLGLGKRATTYSTTLGKRATTYRSPDKHITTSSSSGLSGSKSESGFSGLSVRGLRQVPDQSAFGPPIPAWQESPTQDIPTIVTNSVNMVSYENVFSKLFNSYKNTDIDTITDSTKLVNDIILECSNNNITHLILDYDGTITNKHGRYTDDYIRPFFVELINAVIAKGINVTIVTFSEAAARIYKLFKTKFANTQIDFINPYYQWTTIEHDTLKEFKLDGTTQSIYNLLIKKYKADGKPYPPPNKKEMLQPFVDVNSLFMDDDFNNLISIDTGDVVFTNMTRVHVFNRKQYPPTTNYPTTLPTLMFGDYDYLSFGGKNVSFDRKRKTKSKRSKRKMSNKKKSKRRRSHNKK